MERNYSGKISLKPINDVVKAENIPLKTRIDVFYQKSACRLAESIFRRLRSEIRQGRTTAELNRLSEKYILKGGGTPSLKGYRGYPASICTSVNNVAAHGIPGDYVLLNTDVITVDLTTEINGWHGDMAWTFSVGEPSPDVKRLLKASWQATMAGINAARAGNRLGDIGWAIQNTAKKFGCTVLEDLVGHGIGRNLHEEPVVLNFGESGTGLPVVPGMVLTIEPILSLGDNKMKTLDDGWSIVTKDNSLCAQYEHTIAVFGQKTEILTLSENLHPKYIDFPPFF